MSRIIIALGLLASIAAPLAAFAADKPKTDDKVHVATCRDGREYWSTSTEHRGACSGAGGVAKWSDGTPVRSHAKKGEYR